METKNFLSLTVLLALIVIGVTLTSGCIMLPFMASWTKTQPQSHQNLTPHPPATEINTENNGLSVKISPTEDNTVAGIVTVRLVSLPSQTDSILVVLIQQGYSGPTESSPLTRQGLVERLLKPAAGQEVLLDTSKVETGVYNLNVAAGLAEAPSDNPWLAVVSVQVVVNNSAPFGNATG